MFSKHFGAPYVLKVSERYTPDTRLSPWNSDGRSSEFYGDSRVSGWTRLLYALVDTKQNKSKKFLKKYYMLQLK